MKLGKRILIYMLAALMTIGPLPVWGNSELPDFSRAGSISVTIRSKDAPVPGGSLRFYKVADLVYRDDNCFLSYTKPFQGCSSSLDALESEKGSAQITEEVVAWVKKEEYQGEIVPIGSDGIAVLENLTLGLYLIMQDEAAEGYEPINSFLVTIPIDEDGKLVYDVDATPKVETVNPDKPDNPPDNPPHNPPSNPPGKPPRLPQTGQLWWPVPILVAAGILFLLLGWRKHRE